MNLELYVWPTSARWGITIKIEKCWYSIHPKYYLIEKSRKDPKWYSTVQYRLVSLK